MYTVPLDVDLQLTGIIKKHNTLSNQTLRRKTARTNLRLTCSEL